MSDDDLIGYCRIHCMTERALFSSEQVNRMIELAGNLCPKVEPGRWFSLHEEMDMLCDLAAKAQKVTT